MAIAFKVTVKQTIEDSKRILHVTRYSSFLGSVVIPGPPWFGAPIIPEVDAGLHEFIRSYLVTDYLHPTFRKAIEQYRHEIIVGVPDTELTWKLVPEDFGSAETWYLQYQK